AGVTQGTNGTVTFTSTNVTYTPGATGTSDSFTYQISDGNGGFATGTISVSILDTSLVVTTSADSGPGSLRAAISAANSGPSGPTYKISFAAGVAGQTILLSNVDDTVFNHSALPVSNNIVIAADAGSSITISRDTNAAA